MTTLAVPTARRRSPYLAHLRTETRLLLRDPAALIFGALAPLVASIVMTVIPGARQPVAEMGGVSVIQTYQPVLILFSSTMLGLTVLPGILGNYRAFGVLRRLRTTPSSPASLLLAVFTLVMVTALLVAALIVLIPGVADAGWPASLGWFSLGAVASTLSFVALGAVLASIVPNAKVAPGVGNAIALVMWAAAGMWYPRAMFPGWLKAAADALPGGAAAEAMLQAAVGGATQWWPYAVLAGWTLVSASVAVRVFRWE